MITKEQVQQTRDRVSLAAQIERGLWQIFESNEFKDIVPCDASADLIRRWCDEFSGAPNTIPTVALFKAARYENPEQWRQEFEGVMKPIADQIFDLISEIIELLRTGGSHSRESLIAERNKLLYFNRDQLLARRDEIQRKQAYNKLPVVDLKQKVARFYEAEARRQNRNVLPPDFTRERLIKNVELVKHCIRRWGVDATNSRLQGDS